MTAPAPATGRAVATFAGVTVVWFALAWVGGITGVLERAPDEPPLRIGLAAGLPVIAVLLALLSARFRAWVARLDLGLLINLQALRAAGFAFLALEAYALLPGEFAWPAGLGDLAVAVTAPFVAWYVARRGQAAWPVFLTWTIFGIVDFIVAVGLGMANGLGANDGVVTGEAAAAPMAHLPLSLIPTFAVPFLTVVHILALVNFRAARAADPS